MWDNLWGNIGMKIFNLADYKNGWIIGDFDPSLLRTKNFECAVHTYPKGHVSDGHFHKVATEYNLIIKGKCEVWSEYLNKYIKMRKQDGWAYFPGQKSNVRFLKDTTLLIIKCPSVKGDKYYN